MNYMPNNFTPIHTHEEYLQALANATSLTPAEMQKVVDRYLSVGGFLDRDGSSIKGFNPRVHPQGSVLLGTAIRPINDNDELDVDLVCLLRDLSKTDLSQKTLKRLVSDEIRLYATSQSMQPPHEGRRCITLTYRDEIGFHVDVLPALPDAEGMRSALQKQILSESTRNHLLGSVSDKSIAITCTDHHNHNIISNDWPVSNPEGYGEWFADQQTQILLEKRLAIFDSQIHANVDDIPLHRVRTPLQDIVKVLKWDRDVTLGEDDDKPISVIITTLAAHAYRGEATLVEAMRTILTTMEEFIEERGGVIWIANPTNPGENFADRWADNPRKKTQFFKWLRRAQRTYLGFLRQPLSENSSTMLSESIQPGIVEKLNKRLVATTDATNLATPAIITRQVDKVRQERDPNKPWARKQPED